jgi:DNA-binding PadR family transcriptional regulator
MTRDFLGEFEQLVLLAVLQEGEGAFGLEVRSRIETDAGRTVSRGAFYTTLERLEKKGYLTWGEAVPEDSRRSGTLRRYAVTPEGVAAVRTSRAAADALARGLDSILGTVG